jgi:AcrR family transcriptional regulator
MPVEKPSPAVRDRRSERHPPAREGPPQRDRRDAIVRAATKLFVENDAKRTSLESVAAAAGVTRTAVYYYFPSKADLVQEVIKRLDWDWWLNAIERSKLEPSLSGRLRILLRTLVTEASEHNGTIYFALVDAAREDDEVRAGLRSQLQMVRASIRDMVNGCEDIRPLPKGRRLNDVVDGVLGMVWCMSSGVANTRNQSVLAQVTKAIDLICSTPAGPVAKG